uniref:Uncharacterized protein n=1 Tax=Brassica oleracea TaxID=3712 RepID=A0A3P6GI94_BRAOL|nr:unnamed protein product [Brassica oleracea]
MLSSKDELFVLGEIQLEEGEIGVEGGRESIDMSSIGRKESRNQDDEKGFWITKHSKHYRRALREMESWRALGSIGNPPKSAKILIRGSSSGLNSSGRQRVVRSWVQSLGPAVGALLETHVHESNLHSVLEAMALGWSSIGRKDLADVESKSVSGGLLKDGAVDFVWGVGACNRNELHSFLCLCSKYRGGEKSSLEESSYDC